LKLIFFGTSAVCLPFLEALQGEFDISLIVTQPDSVGGRHKQTIVPPVKTFALANGIPVIQPHNLKDDGVIAQIAAVGADLGVVIAYGRLIPKRVFLLPRLRTVNVHFSLLPQYRGAAPVQRALEKGDPVSGISIFEIVKKLDAGPIWAQLEMPLLPEDTTETVWQRMSAEGAAFLNRTVRGIWDGSLQQTPQLHDAATLAPPVDKHEGYADWNLTASLLFNKFRAFTPWPGLCCFICGKLFKLTDIRVSELTHDRKPGVVLAMDKKSLKVCCGAGTVLEVFQLQPQGKKPMTPYCYCQGNRLPDCLE